MTKLVRTILIIIIPAFFTAIMINGLYNYAGTNSNFYLFFGLGSPFFVVMFGGLCKIMTSIFDKIGFMVPNDEDSEESE
ncbi:MAG: hypothetical protein GY714_31310 [Desulfobacterales bacterium]|nr:hypothetical protein [Desulfobacterales bacterium]MCP4159408.1 hypothetical protein [Deltaproteobacteria bacterium]